MSEKMKWGVMGNATIARVCVIPAIQKSRNGRVHAIASRTPQRAAEVAQYCRIEKIYGDYQSLLEDPAIEAIYIPLPNHLHHPWGLAALAAGKHVLCEKPLACNALEAEEMAVAAKQARRILMEAFMYRFHPRSRRIHALVRSDRIGPPRLIRSAFCYRMADSDYNNPDNARLQQSMGGGALLDVGCYGVSVARWMFDMEPVQVQCQAGYHPDGVDLHAVGLLGFVNGRLAAIEASMIAGLQQTYTVVGEKGVIELPHDAFIPWEKDAQFTLRKEDADTADPEVIAGADEYQLMVEHFVDACRGRCSLEFSTADSIRNMRVLDALAKAARSGSTVLL
jgi:predicted dehydrogenase